MLNSVQLSSQRNKINDRVKSFVRIRPSANFANDNIEVIRSENNNIIQIHDHTKTHSNIPRTANHLQKSWRFHVDDVLYNADQSEVYTTVAQDLVKQGLQGYSGTLVAYGEAGSGKTFTLSGARDNSDFGQRGLGPRAIGTIFQHIKSKECRNDEFSVSISYLEVQDKRLTDLLVDQQPKKKLEIFEDEVNEGATKVDGLSQVYVKNEHDAFSMFLKGDGRKDRNSHSIFTIYIKSKSQTISGGMLRSAELKFVDLTSWGTSEHNKLNPSHATAPSLTFLEQVVISLQAKCKDSVPWRSCPLTHVLKGSFKRGNTILLTTIFGDKKHLHGSLTTLRFAARINNCPVEPAHVEVNDAESRVLFLESENQKLKDELKMRYILNRRDDSEPSCSNYEPLTVKDIDTARTQVQDYLSFKSQKLDGLSIRHVNKLFSLMREEYHLKDKQVEDILRQKYQFIERDSSTADSIGNTPEKSSKNSKNSKNNKDSKEKAQEAETNETNDKKGNKDSKSKDSKNSKNTKNAKTHGSDSKTSIHNSDSNKLVNDQLSESLENFDKKFSSASLGDKMINNFNISEAYDDFKKNSGRVNYVNIKNCKKARDEMKNKMHDVAETLNFLVDDIRADEGEVERFTEQGPKGSGKAGLGGEQNIITEEQCSVRKRLAERKNKYVSLKKTYDELVVSEIKIDRELESFRKQLLIEFSEEYPHQDVFKIVNLEDLSDGRANESNQPPFSINQQKEQDDPSFNPWQGARTELYNNRMNHSGNGNVTGNSGAGLGVVDRRPLFK